MSNEDVKDIFNDVYNNFWNKHKGAVLLPDDKQWESVEQEAKDLIIKYAGAPLVVHMVGELMNILDERGKAQYG